MRGLSFLLSDSFLLLAVIPFCVSCLSTFKLDPVVVLSLRTWVARQCFFLLVRTFLSLFYLLPRFPFDDHPWLVPYRRLHLRFLTLLFVHHSVALGNIITVCTLIIGASLSLSAKFFLLSDTL